MLLPFLASLVTPFTRNDCPGSDRLFKYVVGNGNAKQHLWQNAPTRWVKGKHHGYLMECHLSDWMDRYTYFHGQFYEAGVQLVLKKLIQPGDHMIDVGANVGMLTLLSSHLVGPNGRVYAIEPNSDCCSRIQRQLHKNRIENVQLHALAFSNATGEAELKIVPSHAGYSTLSELSEQDQQTFTQSEQIATIRGDEFIQSLTDQHKPIKLIKMDIEGHETQALRGFTDTLTHDRPVLITEMNPCCLKRAGSSAAELFDLLSNLGYQAHIISTHNKRWQPIELRLSPTSEYSSDVTNDVCWIHAEDHQSRSRIAEHIHCPAPMLAAA
ncbi:hypothetical protein KS4_07410 [Poriferisphaera corsica]|uniref:Methyltransferase FkbM domain-containing protein n=1 Tax=Poriferisphaera corsica TaxID=2528020 RepID=A0A517YR51_9BACT|nr:FkbM family methyltransferase [Poriferisphaera corsica]QDU32707.1 hypothetical protein KS4_07410 [Poriferisphaera corsica]